MKKLLLFSMFLVFCGHLLAQIPTAPNATDAQGRKKGKWVICFDEQWNVTNCNNNKVAYYRVANYENGKPIGKVKDYYAYNQKLQFEGEMLDDTPKNEKPKGLCVWYSDKGNKLQEMLFDDKGNLLEKKLFDEKGNVLPAEQVKALEDLEKGIQLNQEGKHQEALPYLESAKKILNKDNFGEQYHFLLGSLVFATQNLKMWSKASRYSDEYLMVMKEKFGENHKQYIETCLDVATIYEMANEFEKAEKCYQVVLKYVEKTEGKDSQAYVAQLSNLASSYFLRNNFEKAITYLKEAKNISEKLSGRNTLNYAMLVENLGQCYRYMKDCKNAKPYLQEALEIFKNQKGTSSKEYERTQKALKECQ
ncbi:MAG: hypothetical protein OHK0045_24620 [Raineya sp.]